MADGAYDKVTRASLGGIYVKAREMDRGHNGSAAPAAVPPGASADGATHASTHASNAPDAATGASPRPDADVSTHASDAG